MALFRSYLFAPGNSERLLDRVGRAGADAIVLDLEDAVPASEKNRSRELVRQRVEELSSQAGPVYVRINAADTPWWEDDLRAVVSPHIRGVRLPKAESHDDVERVSTVLDELENERSIVSGTLELFATIETAAGVWSALEIARGARVRNLSFGTADFLADVGAELSSDETETLFARSRLVVVSRIAGIDPPVAPVHTKLGDTEALRQSSESHRRLGFFGRSVIHPKQLDTVHEVFTPSASALENAQAVVEAYQRASERRSGAMQTDDGQFIDAAIVRRARAVLALAESIGLDTKPV